MNIQEQVNESVANTAINENATDTPTPIEKPITGVFAQQAKIKIDKRTGEKVVDKDANENVIYSNSFTFTMENKSKEDFPATISARRIQALKMVEPKAFRLDETKDYVRTNVISFKASEEKGFPPAVRAWYRPKAEPVTI